MKTLGAYARVSTEEQAKEGFSIEAQTKILQAYAIVKGYDNVIMYVDDGYSGKNLRRPEVQRMIADCKAHRLDGVAVWRYDRLSRSLRDTLSLVEDIFNANGIAFISTSEQIDTTTPSGRLVLNILASCAQNEREVTEQRVRMVCMELAKQCKHMGGLPPFGYRVVNERLQVYEPEAEAVRTLFRMYTEGHGYGDLLKYLDGNGFTTIRGNSFRKNSLYEILGNEKYIGVYTYNRTVAADKNGRRNNHANKADDEIVRVDGGVPAIIDMETWRRAVEKRITNKKRTGVYKAKSVYLLTGLAVCGKCGRKIGGNTGGTDRDGTMQRYYVAPCKHVRRVRKEKIEEFAINFIKYIASDPTKIGRAHV